MTLLSCAKPGASGPFATTRQIYQYSGAVAIFMGTEDATPRHHADRCDACGACMGCALEWTTGCPGTEDAEHHWMRRC